MQAESAEPVPIDERRTLTQADLCSLCRLSGEEVEELVDYGVLTPVVVATGGPLFNAAAALALRQAASMRARFDLDLFTLGLLFTQLERIADLERQVRTLEVHLQHPARADRPPGR